MYYEEILVNGKNRKLFKKKDKKMDKKETVKKTTKTKTERKPKMTLTIYTYLNFKHFGLAIRAEDGIKITVLWFETHIKFEKR